MWLMQALGFLLSALQVEEILKNLHSLISPYIQQLEKLAEEIVSEPGRVGGGMCLPRREQGGTLGLVVGVYVSDCLSVCLQGGAGQGCPFA